MFTREKIFLEEGCPCQLSSEKHSTSWLCLLDALGFPSPSTKVLFQHDPVPRTSPLSGSYFLPSLHIPRGVLIPSKSRHSKTFNNQPQPIPWITLHFWIIPYPWPISPILNSGSHFQDSPSSSESRPQLKEQSTEFPSHSPCPLSMWRGVLVYRDFDEFPGNHSLLFQASLLPLPPFLLGE